MFISQYIIVGNVLSLLLCRFSKQAVLSYETACFMAQKCLFCTARMPVSHS